MNNEELMAEIAKRPVLERLSLLNDAMQLRLITVQDAVKVMNEPAPKPVRTAKKAASK